MCDQTEILYLDGDVVWVKLGPTWWPGEVLGTDRVPPEVLSSLRKTPIAVVKFFREESLELVKNINSIYKYNCSKKHEFIKKGLDQFRAKHVHMELFPDYVREAEERTHGDPHILDAPEYQPPQKVDYAGLFGARKTPGSPSKQKVKSSTSPSDTEFTPKITHPRILQKFLKGTSDYKAHILVQEPKQEEGEGEGGTGGHTPAPTSGHYTCHACPFSCTRINVMVLHNKCHSEGYVPYTPPKRHKPRPLVSSTKAKTPRARGRPRAPRRLPALSVPAALPRDTPAPPRDSDPPKSDLEIKNSLLADWSEDSNESMDLLSALKLTENQSAKDDSSVHQDSNSDTEQMDTKDDEKENSLNVDNESPKDKKISLGEDVDSKKISLSEDVDNKSCERKVGSCFDFDDDDEEIPIETIGRKIPRLSIKSDDGSRKILDLNPEPAEASEPSPAEEDNLSNNLAVDLKLDAEINSLLLNTALPTLPTLPVEPKFVESLIKSPEKDSGEVDKEKPQTKSIFKTKTFFRSRHTRSQDAIEKYVADNTSVDKPPTYMEEPPEHDSPLPQPSLPDVPDILHTIAPEVKVPKFALKIQLKKMKAALGEKENPFIVPPENSVCQLDSLPVQDTVEVIPKNTEKEPSVGHYSKDSHLTVESVQEELTNVDSVQDVHESIEEVVTPVQESVEEEVTSFQESTVEEVTSVQESIEELTPVQEMIPVQESILNEVTPVQESSQEEVIPIHESIQEEIISIQDIPMEEHTSLGDNIPPHSDFKYITEGLPEANVEPEVLPECDIVDSETLSQVIVGNVVSIKEIPTLEEKEELLPLEKIGHRIEETVSLSHHMIVEEKTEALNTSKDSTEFDIQDRWNNESVDNLLKTSTEEEKVVNKTCTVNDILGTMEDNDGCLEPCTSRIEMVSPSEMLNEEEQPMPTLLQGPTESDLQIAETLITLPTAGAPIPSKLLENDQNFSAAKSLVQMSEALQSEQLPSVDAFSLEDSLVTMPACDPSPIIPPLSPSPKKTVSIKDAPVEHSKLFQILDEPIKQKNPIKIIQNKPIPGKEKILNFQTGTPPHKPRVIIRRSGPARAPPLLLAAPSRPTGKLLQDEEAFFDINSMPIVLSEEILTPENLDKMPIVLSEGLPPSAQAKVKVITPIKELADAKKEKSKLLAESNYQKLTAPLKKYGESKMNALLKPVMEKSASPNILSKSPKIRATKHLLVVDKTTGEQKIITTKSEEAPLPSKILMKNTPTILTQQPKGEKFIILPPGTSSGTRTQKIIVNPQTGKSQIIIEEGQGKMKAASTAKIIQNRSGMDPTGNTVMILTNSQGVQSKIVLTPEHQRILFPKKGTGPVVTSHTILSPRSRTAVTSQSIITSRGQLLGPISGNALITSTGQLLPPRGRTVLTAKPNQTILTSRGQLITTQSSPVTSQAKVPQVTNITSMPISRPSISRAPKQGLLKASPKPSGPQTFIKSTTGKLISTDPASILQGKKPGTVMHLTAAQFEHLQKTGQIITTSQPSLTQIISPSQNKGTPGKMQQKFILQKYASNSKQSPQLITKQVEKKAEVSGMKRKALPSLVPSQPAPPPLKKQKLRELLTIKADSSTKKFSSPVSKNAMPQPVMDLGNLDDLIPATTISTCKGETRGSRMLQVTHSAPTKSDTHKAHARQRNSEIIIQKPPEISVPEPGPPVVIPPPIEEVAPSLAAEGQLLAVPGENFGGPPNSFYLCMEENGTLTPIDNQPLVLENNQLVPMVLPPPVPEQRVILNAGEQQILVDQQTLLSLLGGEARGVEGQQLLLQGDVRQLLAALAPQQAPHSQDILAAALADTGDSLLMEMDSLGPDFHSLNASVSVNSNVSETSTTLKPIMSALEQPSKKRALGGGNVGRLPPVGRLEDTLAVIGVSPPSVPTSLDLPITVTDPRIAPKVSKSLCQVFPPLEDKQDTTHTTASLLTRVSQTNQQMHFSRDNSLKLPSHEKSNTNSREDFRRLPKQPASSMPCLDDSSSDSFASENPQLLTEAIQTKTYSPISMPLLTEDTSEAPLTGELVPESLTSVKSMPVLMDSDDSTLRDGISTEGQPQSEESQESEFTEELPTVHPSTQPDACEILTQSCKSNEMSTISSELNILQHDAPEVTDQDIPVETDHNFVEQTLKDDSISHINEHGDYDVSEMGEQIVSDNGEHAVPDVEAQASNSAEHNILETAQHNMPILTEHGPSDIFEAGISNTVQHSISDIIEHVSHEIIEHCESNIIEHDELKVIEDGVSHMTQINEMTMTADGASEIIQDSETPMIKHGESIIVEDVSKMTETEMIEPSVSKMTQNNESVLEITEINETAMIEQGVSNMIEDGVSEISQDNEMTMTERGVSNIIIEDGEADMTQHNEEIIEDGASNMIQINDIAITESNAIEDTGSDIIQNDEIAMVEQDVSNNVTDHMSDIDQGYEPAIEQNESEIIQDGESDFIVDEELSVIAQEHQEEFLSDMNNGNIPPNMEDKNGLHGEVISENGSVAHLDIAPSSVPSEACSSPASPGPASPDVLPPHHNFSDSSSNSSVEIPIQPSICVSQQRLAGFKRSPPHGSPPASPKRFKFHDER